MAKNVLTPEQDIATRNFYTLVASKAESLLPSQPAFGRQLRAILLLLLNYNLLPGGIFVSKDIKIDVPFGSNDYSQYKDEWAADMGKALAEVEINRHEGSNDTDTSEASTSESSEGPKVRETLLREDV